MVEYGHKIEEGVKAMKSEIKENDREPTVKGRKPELKINGLYWKEKNK